MPSKFIVRNFKENRTYHVYNKAISKDNIFLDVQDYRVFLFYLYIYTSPNEEVSAKYSDLPKRFRDKSLVSQINILAYCLMADHFHLIIVQLRKDSIPKLMKQVVNGYTSYFNHKYKHMGPVFAGRYKAVEVGVEDTLPDLTRYIHLEPVKRGLANSPKEYEWSSYNNYFGEKNNLRCDIDPVLNKIGTLEKFVEYHADRIDYKRRQDQLKKVLIENPDIL